MGHMTTQRSVSWVGVGKNLELDVGKLCGTESQDLSSDLFLCPAQESSSPARNLDKPMEAEEVHPCTLMCTCLINPTVGDEQTGR